ncbi:MAG: aminotransferase [Polyangiaceae bacterium]
MTVPINPLLSAVSPPPIPEVHGWLEGREFPSSLQLIDVAQAVPSGVPPMAEHLNRVLANRDVWRYTAIEGLAELREALAADISATYSAPVGPEHVLVTAGCNQAFCLATLAVAQSGDEIVLPVPYYFNHQMWLDMMGVRGVHLPFRPEADGVPSVAQAAERITPRTRAIVLVTPNNPTGALYPPEVLRGFFELAKDKRIALILDETYRDFLPAAGPPHDLFGDSEWGETLVHLYSFSKAFSITGHRVGAIAASASFLAQVGKAMDCVAICAPRLGQEAALFGLRELGPWRAQNAEAMRGRLAAFRTSMEVVPQFQVVSAGAYFAYVRHPFRGVPATEVARRLATEQNLLCLPGSMFGPAQDEYLRFAFANIDEKVMPQLVNRLFELAS